MDTETTKWNRSWEYRGQISSDLERCVPTAVMPTWIPIKNNLFPARRKIIYPGDKFHFMNRLSENGVRENDKR